MIATRVGPQLRLAKPTWLSRNPFWPILHDYLVANNADSKKEAESNPTTATAVINSAPADINDPESWHFHCNLFFATLYHAVKQIPHTHPSQDLAVALVLAIRSLAPPSQLPREIEEDWLDKPWRDLPGLKSAFHDFEEMAPLHPPLTERPEIPMARRREWPPWWKAGVHLTGEEWANLNAFMARLHGATGLGEDSLRHLDLKALVALLDALEEDQTPSALEDLVPAAAVWIIYAGKEIRGNEIQYAPFLTGENKRMPWDRGELYDGPGCFNEVRWKFWRERFTVVAES